MDSSAKLILSKEVEAYVKAIQKSLFNVLDDLKASDLDNVNALRDILKDDELAGRFELLQDNRHKLVRKKILDATGDLQRTMLNSLEKYDIKYIESVELKSYIKGN